GTVSASLGGVAHLNKTTLGTVTLNGANTFSGDTRVQYGILRVGHGLALQNSTVHLSSEDQGTLDLNALDVTLGGLKGVRDLQIPDGRKLSVGYNNNSTTYAGTLKGKDVVLEKIGTGTFIITGDNIYSGVTKISAGALQIGDGGTSGSINTPIENNGVLWFNRADSLEFKKTISGSGNLVKVGQGTLVLSGDNNYTGNTIVQQGTLLVNGNYAGNGTFQVGSLAATTAVLGGIGTITGNVYAAQLGEISPGTSIGTLSIEGNVILAGTLRVELNAEGTGFADMLLVSGVFDINSASLVFSYDSPPDDPAYIFVTYGSRTGKGFVRVDNLPPGYRIDYNYLGQNKIAIVVPEPVGGPGTLLVAVGAHTIIQRLKNRRGTTRTPRRETRAGS
ncbi:MAG: autotransporter-associated beta strand repeat-containing protein, partial [Verrucomicrobiae bacterium]|nr:autotransporter-associated beta strand repeat-containing protein [Verrucomicrobiae bacterium]